MENKIEIDAKYYAMAKHQFNDSPFSKSDDIWTKALTIAKGNEDEAEFICIEMRAEELQKKAIAKVKIEKSRNNSKAWDEIFKFFTWLFVIIVALFNLPFLFEIVGYIFTPTIFMLLALLFIGSLIYSKIKERKIVKEVVKNGKKELGKSITWWFIFGFFLLIVFMN
jgi:hypothetical protein